MTTKTDGIDGVLKLLDDYAHRIAQLNSYFDRGMQTREEHFAFRDVAYKKACTAILDYVEKMLPERCPTDMSINPNYRDGFNDCRYRIKQSIAKERGSE